MEYKQIPLRLSEDLHQKIKEVAKKEGRSRNNMIVRILQQFMLTESMEPTENLRKVKEYVK